MEDKEAINMLYNEKCVLTWWCGEADLSQVSLTGLFFHSLKTFREVALYNLPHSPSPTFYRNYWPEWSYHEQYIWLKGLVSYSASPISLVFLLFVFFLGTGCFTALSFLSRRLSDGLYVCHCVCIMLVFLFKVIRDFAKSGLKGAWLNFGQRTFGKPYNYFILADNLVDLLVCIFSWNTIFFT